MNKRQIAHLQKQFAGYTVLNASDDGMRVCLASEESGALFGYTFKDEEDKAHVFPERIVPIRVNAVFQFDTDNAVEIDADQVIDMLSAKLIAANSDAAKKADQIAALESENNILKEEKKAWRIQEAKKAVMSRLDALNKDRDARCAYGKELADKVCARAEKGCFNETCEDGEWCGDKMAVMELEALCAQEQAKFDADAKAKEMKKHSWNEYVQDDGKTVENDASQLLSWINKE